MDKDEHYIIALCDEVLEATGRQQHKFAFLLGDESAKGARRKLPVDAYYPEHKLVIEYREVQHTAPVALWDKKPTLSGSSRAEQRRKYDARRRVVLPAYDIKVVELDYSMFAHGSNKRLRRDPVADKETIRAALRSAGCNC